MWIKTFFIIRMVNKIFIFTFIVCTTSLDITAENFNQAIFLTSLIRWGKKIIRSFLETLTKLNCNKEGGIIKLSFKLNGVIFNSSYKFSTSKKSWKYWFRPIKKKFWLITYNYYFIIYSCSFERQQITSEITANYYLTWQTFL